jgi:TRAP-type transport system periplasmic protein
MASVAAPAVMRVAWADPPQVVLKLHHALSSVSSAHDRFLAPWARKVEAESGGRIRIDLFPSMQLGGQPMQLFEQARDGVAELVWAMNSATPGRFPKTEVFELPFVPARRALVSSKALDDFARANLADEYREVHPICFACADAAVIHTMRPVHTVEDIKGLKLHVQTRLGADALRFLGAQPVPMPPSQLPAAVAAHVIDGCVDPWDLVPGLKLNDLLKAHTDFAESALSTTTYILAMNKPAYDKLPRDLKSVIDANSGQPAATMAGAMWDSSAAAAADMVSVAGDTLTTLQMESVARWRHATEPLVEAWVKRMREHRFDGAKLLANARAALVRYANEPEVQPPQRREPSPQQQQPAEAKADTNSTPQRPETPKVEPPKVETLKVEPPKVETPTTAPSPPPKQSPPNTAAATPPTERITTPTAPAAKPTPPPAAAAKPATVATPSQAPAATPAPAAPAPAAAPPAHIATPVAPAPPPPAPPAAVAAPPPPTVQPPAPPAAPPPAPPAIKPVPAVKPLPKVLDIPI